MEKNVIEFLKKSSALCGRLRKENFSIMAWMDLSNLPISSPIEKIFFIALLAYCELYNYNYKTLRTKFDDEYSENYKTLYIQPQFSIDKFKVDFLIETYDVDGNLSSVVVELDGHDFHDKDKHQRAYEKSRDRFLTREGFKVLHFTGSEIFNDPFKAVLESFVIINISIGTELLNYSSTNPFGID